MRHIALALVLIPVLACGSGSPTKSSPTATSLVVSIPAPVLMSKTAQASATATMTTGTTESVTTGWKSDNLEVATVSDSGLVTGVANGGVNISVVFAGKTGVQLVRVVPNYPGQWGGGYIVRSCSNTGFFSSAGGICPAIFPANRVLPADMLITQNGESISGQFTLGQIVFESFNSPIEGDGSAAVVATSTVPANPPFTVEARWRLNSTVEGQITGRLTQIVRTVSPPGEARIESDIFDWLSRVVSPRAIRTVLPRDLHEALRAMTRK